MQTIMSTVVALDDAMASVPGFHVFQDIITELEERNIMDHIHTLPQDVYKQPNNFMANGVKNYEFGFQF
jgi:hypothetical protein